MKKLNVGIVGLGRLGMKYAEIMALKNKDTNLVAACSVNDRELDYAKEKLGVKYTYTDYKAMLENDELESVFIISSTNQHAEHMIMALEKGLHVFCEKPLAITLADCLQVEEVAKSRPDQIAVVGFVRRFDDGYRYAKQKVDEGAIGEPFLVKSQTVDLDATAGFQMEFVKSSGGMFHDFNVHDIDLARWFLGSEIKTVYSIGNAYKHKAFAEVNDADNVMSTCLFDDGKMANIIASRTAASGHDTYTEVVGTEGLLRIGRPNMVVNVEIYDQHGTRQENVKTFYERFERAFYNQIEDFVDCVLTGRKPELMLSDATRATQGAIAMTNSLFEGQGLVQVDEIGNTLVC